MIAATIVICEIAFWVLLLAGLTARYALGQSRLSTILLICVPLVDVVLLTVTAIDLGGGTQAQWTHGLAAVYLGFSVVFGPSLVRDADRRFARHFADNPPAATSRAPANDRVAAEWRLWVRCLLASGLACGVLGALILIAGDPERTRALWAGGGSFAQLGALCAIWLLLGPTWTAASHHARRRTINP